MQLVAKIDGSLQDSVACFLVHLGHRLHVTLLIYNFKDWCLCSHRQVIQIMSVIYPQTSWNWENCEGYHHTVYFRYWYQCCRGEKPDSVHWPYSKIIRREHCQCLQYGPGYCSHLHHSMVYNRNCKAVMGDTFYDKLCCSCSFEAGWVWLLCKTLHLILIHLNMSGVIRYLYFPITIIITLLQMTWLLPRFVLTVTLTATVLRGVCCHITRMLFSNNGDRCSV